MLYIVWYMRCGMQSNMTCLIACCPVCAHAMLRVALSVAQWGLCMQSERRAFALRSERDLHCAVPGSSADGHVQQRWVRRHSADSRCSGG